MRDMETTLATRGAVLPFAKPTSAAEQLRWSCRSPHIDIIAIDLLSTAPETVKTAFSYTLQPTSFASEKDGIVLA